MDKISGKINGSKLSTVTGRVTNVINAADLQRQINELKEKDIELFNLANGIRSDLQIEIQNRIADVERLLLQLSNESEIRAQKDEEIRLRISIEVARLTEVINTLQSELIDAINNEASIRLNKDDDLQSQINTEIADRQDADNDLQSQIDTEIAARQEADSDLQSQIDAIESKADVVDVVACYNNQGTQKTDIVHYNTSTLTDQDVVKVLDDETRGDATTYYRWVITSGVGDWDYVGSVGPYVTLYGEQTIDGAKTFVNSSGLAVEYKEASSPNWSKKIVIKNNGFEHVNNDSLASQKLVFAEPIVSHTITIPAKDGTIALDENVVHNTGDEPITGIKTFDANGEIRFVTDPDDVYHGYIKESSRLTLDISDLTVNVGGSMKTVVGSSAYNIELDNNILPGGRTNVIAIHDSAINAAGTSQNDITYVFPTRNKTDGSTYTLATEDYVDDAIAALPEPMIFKGSIGTGGTVEWANLPSPAAGNTGWTYKAITKHTTAPICEIGDTIISDGSTWWVIPSGDVPDGTVTSVGTAAETNSGLTLTGGPITASGTITVGLNSGYELLNSNTNQTIAGNKTFTSTLTVQADNVDQGDTAVLLSSFDGNIALSTCDGQISLSSSYGSISISAPVINPNGQGYGLELPATTGWATNKTIAVDEDVVHKTGEETISGQKKFDSGKLAAKDIYYIGSSYTTSALTFDSNGLIYANLSISPSDDAVVNSSGVVTSGKHLGSPQKRWGNIFIAGSLNDGTNSVTVANIAKDDNVIHKGTSSIASNEDIYGLKTFKGVSSGIKAVGDNNYTYTYVSTSGLHASTGTSSAAAAYSEYGPGTIQNLDTTTASPELHTIALPKKSGTLAVDGDVVHKGSSSSSVAETIYGNKTFANKVDIYSGFEFRNAAYDYPPTTITSSNDGLKMYFNGSSQYLQLASSGAGYINIQPKFNATGVISNQYYNNSTLVTNTLNLPNASGTIATTDYVDAHTFPVCTKTTTGNYILQAQVASDGTVTYDWILDNLVRLS